MDQNVRPRLPVAPGLVLGVQLPAAQWNLVLAGLDEMPHRVSRQVIDAVTGQLRDQTAPPPMGPDDAMQGGIDGFDDIHSSPGGSI